MKTRTGQTLRDAVASLVEKSLIASRIDSHEASYRLLDTTRSYALEKLIASGEHEAIATRHAIYSAELLEANSVDFFELGIPKDTQLVKDYLGNVRAALEWSFGPGGSDELAIRLAAAAGPLFLAMSLLTECRNWMERAIERMLTRLQSAASDGSSRVVCLVAHIHRGKQREGPRCLPDRAWLCGAVR